MFRAHPGSNHEEQPGQDEADRESRRIVSFALEIHGFLKLLRSSESPSDVVKNRDDIEVNGSGSSKGVNVESESVGPVHQTHVVPACQ